MQTLFYDDGPLDELLARASGSIFLAGPTARGLPRTPWRERAMALLQARRFSGAVVVPEFRDRPFDEAAPLRFGLGASPVPHLRDLSFHILRWETVGLEQATVALFWMPFGIAGADDPTSLPGFTTRAEVSREMVRAPQRLVLGMPAQVLSGGHIRFHAHAAGLTVHERLEETVSAAVELAVGGGG